MDREWQFVTVGPPEGESVTMPISGSFWRERTELRFANREVDARPKASALAEKKAPK